MNRRATFAVWCVLLAGCEPPPRTMPRAAGTAAAGTAPQQGSEVVARTRYHVAQPLWQMTDSAERAQRYRERAKGVVVPTYSEGVPGELNVVNDTAYEIQTVARVRFYSQPDGGWSDTIWTREPGLYTELIRATHDDYGLPVTDLRGRWLQVIYAFAADGSPRAGWVHLVPGKLVYHDRDRQMFEFSTDLRAPANTEFFRVPDGQPVSVDLRPSHTVKVLQIDGDWIQIAVIRPDTSACTGNENLQVQQRDTVWVRRYDERGMRQLTSAVAGC